MRLPDAAQALLAAASIGVGAAAESPYWAIGGLSFGAGWLYFTVGAYWSSTSDLSRAHAGSLSGLMNTGANIGGALSPTVTPWIAHHWGWGTSLGTAAVLAFLLTPLVVVAVFAVNPTQFLQLIEAGQVFGVERPQALQEIRQIGAGDEAPKSFVTKEIGFSHGRLWDLGGMEYFWGSIPAVLGALAMAVTASGAKWSRPSGSSLRQPGLKPSRGSS